MVDIKSVIKNFNESDQNFNKEYIEKGSVYWFQNTEIAKFVKFRERNYGDNYQHIPRTPKYLLDKPKQYHPWIFLKRYQITKKKTKKAFLGTRSHFEKNKKGWVLKQDPHQDINPMHKLKFIDCSIDKEGVYMKNTPIEQSIKQTDMKILIESKNTRFSCIDEEIKKIQEELNKIDETYT
tara:strand:+ start:206 stop:745 length:540 start_codon:yes stop_codon:yes gene_type:complete